MTLLLAIGLQVIVLAVVLFVASPAIKRRWPDAGTAVAVTRNVFLVAGIVMAAVDLSGGQTPMTRTPNPVADTVTSVDAGRATYQANCAACHGVDAQGGGPLAGTTQIPPPSLTAHLSGHSDGDLFYWITNGLPGGMPAWGSQLSETDRWNLVNYLRVVNGATPATGDAPGSTPGPSPAAASIADAGGALASPVGAAMGLGGWLVAGLRRGRRPARRGRRP